MIIVFQPNLLYLRQVLFWNGIFDKDGEIGRRSHPSLSRIYFKKRRAKKGWNLLRRPYRVVISWTSSRFLAVYAKPAIFCYDIYAVAAVVGGIALICFQHFYEMSIAILVSWTITFMIRMFCFWKKVHLPRVRVKISTE